MEPTSLYCKFKLGRKKINKGLQRKHGFVKSVTGGELGHQDFGSVLPLICYELLGRSLRPCSLCDLPAV